MTESKTFRLSEERTEEVQAIIERMPTKFGVVITMIVFLIFSLMMFFGLIVKYPDIVSGQIVINANLSPVKLVSNSNGKLKLNSVRSLDNVKEGQILGYIENSTRLSSVIFTDSLLKHFNPNSENITDIYAKLPKNAPMGELNSQYFTFVNSLQQYINYKKDKYSEKQIENLYSLLEEQQHAVIATGKRLDMANRSLQFTHKFYIRDSMLFLKKIISESELDKSQISYISGKDAYQNSISNFINSKQSARQTKSQIQELSIQKPEKEKDLHLALISSYNDLVGNIKSWEQKYVFRSPMDGKLQFLKFYTENQYLQNGEQVFSIVPKQGKVIGQVILPASGSGKVKVGQEVIVKLDNFPYLEYGSIMGRVRSISLTTNITKTDKNEIETYMVLVDFQNQLKTNYGAALEFRAEAKGTAEIITKDRRLMMRLFDNLKYVIRQ